MIIESVNTFFSDCIVKPPKNGRTLEEKLIYKHSENITYVCNEKFTLKGDSVKKCENGVLSAGFEPICLPTSDL